MVNNCPFCGNDLLSAQESVNTVLGQEMKHKYIQCLTCGARGPATYPPDSEEDAWNRCCKYFKKCPDARTSEFAHKKHKAKEK